MNDVSPIASPSNTSSNLTVSTTPLTLVKAQLYQCWIQVYGPLFWIVSALLCLYSTAPPRPAVVRRAASVHRPAPPRAAIEQAAARPDQPVFPKMENDVTSSHPKRSLRRSIKHHMLSFKQSLNEAVRRSFLRRNHRREEQPVHPLDKGGTQTARRKSFGGYSQHPIFNPFRRKTAPELAHCN